MGNYRQHLTASSFLGAVFAWGAHALAGLHWLYGSVAALLATVAGLLPDLDHPTGVEMRGVTGTLGVLAGLVVWHHVGESHPGLAFEAHLWSVVLAYFFVRYGLRHTLSRLMVHRGISHSLPACAVWGCLTYLYYPSPHHVLRAWMAAAVAAGFLSHLVLDEVFSVDIAGNRLKRSFGTALKFWAPSAASTLAIYSLLFLLARQVVDTWPGGPLASTFTGRVPEPSFPRPESWWPPALRPSKDSGPTPRRPGPLEPGRETDRLTLSKSPRSV